MIDLLRQNNTANAQVLVLEKLLLAVNVNPVSVKLMEILNLSTGLNDAAFKTNLNIFDLANALVLLANSKNAINAVVSVPPLKIANFTIADAVVRLKVIEPPQWAVGNPAVDKIRAKTSQVKLDVITNVDLFVAEVKLRLSVEVGAGSAEVIEYSCLPSQKKLVQKISSGLLRISTLTENPSESTVVKIIGIPIDIKLNPKFEQIFPLADFNPAPKMDEEPLWKKFDLNMKLVSILLGGIVDLVVDTLSILGIPDIIFGPVLKALLSPLGELLDAIVGPLLKMLGINLGQVEVGGQLNCSYQADLVF